MTGTNKLAYSLVGILLWAVVWSAVAQATVVFIWGYIFLWEVLVWVTISFVILFLITMTYALIRDAHRLSVTSKTVHEVPPIVRPRRPLTAEEERQYHERVAEWITNTFPRRDDRGDS